MNDGGTDVEHGRMAGEPLECGVAPREESLYISTYSAAVLHFD